MKTLRLTDIIILESIDSTNNYAIQILKKKKLKEGTVIVAHEQLQGKGQKGNSWESEPGKNLTISLILYPDFLPAERQFLITKAISLSITDLLEKYITDVSIKWPNDIYYKDFKIAGVLIENIILENEISQSIIGIGINVNQDKFLNNAPNPVSLYNITNHEYDLHELLYKLKRNFMARYIQLKKGNVKGLNIKYLQKLYKFEIESEFIAKGKIFKGKIIDIDEWGRLRVQLTNNEIQTFDFKEVEFKRDNITG